MALLTISEHTFIDCLGIKSTVVDLGMNKGHFSRLIRERYGCSVIGCEPNPHLAARLTGIQGISCYPVAVADLDGELEFFIDRNDDTGSSLYRPFAGKDTDRVIIETMTLPAFASRHGLDRIDLLKVDVEGAELAILETIDTDWLSRHIVQMSVEFHLFRDQEARSRIERIRKRLDSAGFFSFDMTMSYMDTLFVNRAFVPTDIPMKLTMAVYKYAHGLARRLGRSVTAQTGMHMN